MIKELLKIGTILILAFGFGYYARSSTFAEHAMKGTVLQLQNGHALVSRRLDLNEGDFSLSETQWLEGRYDLILIGPINGVDPGQKIKFVVEDVKATVYPARATIKSYRLMG